MATYKKELIQVYEDILTAKHIVSLSDVYECRAVDSDNAIIIVNRLLELDPKNQLALRILIRSLGNFKNMKYYVQSEKKHDNK